MESVEHLPDERTRTPHPGLGGGAPRRTKEDRGLELHTLSLSFFAALIGPKTPKGFRHRRARADAAQWLLSICNSLPAAPGQMLRALMSSDMKATSWALSREQTWRAPLLQGYIRYQPSP